MSGLPGFRTYGRCQCRCECMETAVVKVRSYRAPDRWWRALVAARTPWVNACMDCMPHLADQVDELGRIWRP